ncbi:alpha-(1,3)-fucosyltransferase B-like [Dysidea avara]|uniref:alpha-(1,3)-fucosyltransferase B-like n=1 Tax=Dysidea avara TaxID=196820 RepID=UPI00331FF3BF
MNLKFGTVSSFLITAIIVTVLISFYHFGNLPLKKLEVPVLSEDKLVGCSVNRLSRVSQPSSSSCQLHVKNLTIYMDSFQWLNEKWMIGLYMAYKKASEKCSPLPGGGVCTYELDDKCTDGILFYGAHSDLNFIKQHPKQIVISFTMEPEGGPDVLFPPNYHHDVKVSYHRTSNIPIPFICERDRALQLYNMGQPQIPTGRREIIGLISNCKVEWRNNYITELMEHIAIDQLGECYRKKPSRFSRTRRHGNWEDKKLEFLRKSHYKYILAFENIVESEYVTEKVFHGLLTGIIPIYYGDRSVFDYIPGNHTIIYAPDYTPRQLAEYINQIENDEVLYSNFFKDWNLEKMLALHKQYCYDHFMCRICRKALEVRYHQEGCINVKLMENGDH